MTPTVLFPRIFSRVRNFALVASPPAFLFLIVSFAKKTKTSKFFVYLPRKPEISLVFKKKPKTGRIYRKIECVVFRFESFPRK